MLRWGWGQLTSMRTALLLLFLLALASVPGSMIPQASADPTQVAQFKRDNPFWDSILEPLGFYDVYTSAVFSAVYLLLFVSLIGCILPRATRYLRAVRRPPPRLPSRIERLPETASADGVADVDAALSRAERWLRRKRYRIRRTETGISAERGYSREAGNLVFHLSLVAMLIGMAWSNLYGFHGSAVVVEGRGMANLVTQYDDFTPGALADTDRLERFSFEVGRFNAAFETGRVQRGAARRFDAEVRLRDSSGEHTRSLTVNEPLLTAGGTQVNLSGHGYAPIFTVRDGNGDIAFQGPVVFAPRDGNFTSTGVIKVPDARPRRLAFEAFYLPTAVPDQQGPRSAFPDALNPEVYLTGWHGPPAKETGTPENIFTLETSGMTQIPGDDGKPLTARIRPGGGFTLPNGLGSLTFDGWKRWIKVQVSQTPGNPMTLVSLMVGVTGLCLSLIVRPRRLFLRACDGRLIAGGLDRAEAATGLREQVGELLEVAAANACHPRHNGDPGDQEVG